MSRSLRRSISFTVTVSGGTGTKTIYGNELIMAYAVISPASGATIEFLDADNYGLAGATGMAASQHITGEWRLGADDGPTSCVVTGTDGTYTVKLWPK